MKPNDFSMSRPQSSSSLPGYVSTCAYSPPNQYAVYGARATNCVNAGHHWQPQSPSLAPSLSPAGPRPAAALEAAHFHPSFKLPQTDGETD